MTISENLTHDIDTLRSPDGYLNAGIPNYNHLFGRDSCVSALQLLDYDQSIAVATLRTMARYQAKERKLMSEAYPGKMLHEHYPGGTKQILSVHTVKGYLRRLYVLLFWRFPYYGTVDAGAWFIILLHRYYKKTGNEALLREMWPAAVGLTSWLEKRATNRPSRLVAYRRTYAFGLPNQSWKDTLSSSLDPPTAMVEVQGYYYEAYQCLSELALVMGKAADSERYAQRAYMLKESLNQYLWREEDGYSSMAINDKGQHDNAITLNPGHLLFTDIISDDQARKIVSRLMQGDMLTPYGIRTLARDEPAFDDTSYQEGSVWPFDNWVIYQGLLKRGFTEEATIVKDGLFTAYSELGHIPELYCVSKNNKLSQYPEACTIQAWSAGALLNMHSAVNPVL